MFCNCSQTLTAKMHLMMCGWISNTKSVSMLVVRPQNLSQCGIPISCCHNSIFIVSYDFPSQGFGKTVCVGDSKLWGDRPHHSLWWDLEGTVYCIVGIFWGRKLFHGFVAIHESFLCIIRGHGVLWHGKSDQSTKGFFTNSRKFLPRKFPATRYIMPF